MRRNLLVQLTIAILLPYLCGFLIAWLGFYQFERTMEKVAASYAQNLAQSVVARLESSQWDIYPDDAGGTKQSSSRMVGINETLLAGLNVPGIFAVFDNAGQVLCGSDEAKSLIPVLAAAHEDAPQTINGPTGEKYAVLVYPALRRNVSVAVAVALSDLLGPMVSLATFWPFITGLLGLIGIFTVYMMWQKVILPLKDLEQEISTLKLGVDVPLPHAPEAVQELQSLRLAIIALANSAIDKARLSRRYVNDLVRVQEAERETISREIHDGPLQDITAFVQRLRLIADCNEFPGERLQLIHEAGKIAMTCVRDLREICNGLTPPWLDLGLAQALIELSERMSEQLKIKISLDLEEIENFSEDATLAFFRVTQEAVNNSVQHGKAENVKITLKKDNDSVIIQIEDDGEGFVVPEDVAELRVLGHRGLSNMMERMSLVGGTMTMRSVPGEGSIIHCELPIDHADESGSER